MRRRCARTRCHGGRLAGVADPPSPKASCSSAGPAPPGGAARRRIRRASRRRRTGAREPHPVAPHETPHRRAVGGREDCRAQDAVDHPFIAPSSQSSKLSGLVGRQVTERRAHVGADADTTTHGDSLTGSLAGNRSSPGAELAQRGAFFGGARARPRRPRRGMPRRGRMPLRPRRRSRPRWMSASDRRRCRALRSGRARTTPRACRRPSCRRGWSRLGESGDHCGRLFRIAARALELVRRTGPARTRARPP